MTVIGCLRALDNDSPEERCALPEGHLGPHGPAFSAALQPHAFVLDSASGNCIICHCRPRHTIHLEDPALAQPIDPEATEPALRDEQNATDTDPIARYLKILSPDREASFITADPVMMAIAVGILTACKELKRIGDLIERMGDLYDDELDRQIDERLEGRA